MRYFVGDFETTVFDGQTETEVWASGLCELYTEDAIIFNSIDDTFKYLQYLGESCIVYYHNLKFDGTFWIDFLLRKKKYQQAIFEHADGSKEFMSIKQMPSSSFKYSISEKGLWYTITIKYRSHTIELRDSLKLLPFSVKKIGNSFGTKHKKLEMEYKGERHAGGYISPEEKAYLCNDLFVVKEALEIMFDEGHNRLTIGSCCMEEYKKVSQPCLMGKDQFNIFFPYLYDIPIDKEEYGQENAGRYVWKSYRGGWCYLVKGKENKVYKNGITLDVNSLYPSMMSGESGNLYPVGKPTFWKGNYIPEEAKQGDKFFFIRIKTMFKIKKNYLPFISIKDSIFYNSHESLETSDIYDSKTGKYYDSYIDFNGNKRPATVTITLTQVDYELMCEHYTLYNFEILDGCYFSTQTGAFLFDDYIDKYKKIKMVSKGAKRELAKLFLNNLYGKFATSIDSSFKVAYIDNELNCVRFDNIDEYNKKGGFIAIGSAITAYARAFTIRSAQKNFYGKDKDGFIYADTDSIHCNIPLEKVRGVPLSDTEFCKWKCESKWDFGIFVRQKTYIEHENGYTVKCAGMPDRSKHLLIKSITRDFSENKNITEEEAKALLNEEWNERHFAILRKGGYNENEIEFLKTKRTIEDFKVGLKVCGKLMPKRIKGGTVLIDTEFELRGSKW